MKRPYKLAGIAAAIALLAGCASFSPDGGFDAVAIVDRIKTMRDLHGENIFYNPKFLTILS